MKAPFTITYNPDWRKPKPPVDSIHPGEEHLSTDPLGETAVEPSESSIPPKSIPNANATQSPIEEHGPLKDSAPLEKPIGPDEEKVSQVHFIDAESIPATQDGPSTSTPPQNHRPKMNVTWDDTSRKLRKKGHPPQSSSMMAAPPTSEPTPEKTKPSFFSRLSRKPSYPPNASVGPTAHEVGSGTGAPPSPPSSPGWKHHESYFPEYTPIYPTTTFADPYARAYMMTPAEIQAQQHAARVGHAVSVHYPMLPPFNEYGSGASKGQGAWQSGQWGNSNWTGFGLNGERLPDGEGKTFSAPMPKGVLPEKPKAVGAGGGGGDGKKKGGEEGGGGGAATADTPAPEATAAVPDGDTAPAAEGGGGGGGAKKKKKK